MRRLLLGAALLLPLSAAGSGTATPPHLVAAPFHAGQESSPLVGDAENDTRVGQRQSEGFATRSTVPTRFRLWHFAAPVIPVHTASRELVPPDDPTVLGWWGRRAGAAHGATLIVGHSVHTGGGELDDLASTPVGATAVVSGIRYRVARVVVMSKARLARRAAHLFSRHGRPRLVVVSCADYDWATHTWPANAVVVATRI